MNRAFSRDRTVSDEGAYQRVCGIHLSLGGKHAIFDKRAVMRRKDVKFHVDVFAVTEQVTLDGEVVYREGAWRV